ncbi:hypothetical protein RV134_390182 [Roseovarius sp. EC-HK134]|uniref:hypothetical protein n=1 Tax=Roseovarius sp. EC-HK134 TaxID=2038394 RepID=UPI0012563E9F|nr:hypothetical protein [Roseovarius sp. EC-HK134]VVT33620.1 hypothetical protein RV134_390182 [Roseovarius sp. EC-HK134]
MAFFSKLKERLFKSSSKLEEGLEAIVDEGRAQESTPDRTPQTPPQTPPETPPSVPPPPSEVPTPTPPRQKSAVS